MVSDDFVVKCRWTCNSPSWKLWRQLPRTLPLSLSLLRFQGVIRWRLGVRTRRRRLPQRPSSHTERLMVPQLFFEQNRTKHKPRIRYRRRSPQNCDGISTCIRKRLVPFSHSQRCHWSQRLQSHTDPITRLRSQTPRRVSRADRLYPARAYEGLQEYVKARDQYQLVSQSKHQSEKRLLQRWKHSCVFKSCASVHLHNDCLDYEIN